MSLEELYASLQNVPDDSKEDPQVFDDTITKFDFKKYDNDKELVAKKLYKGFLNVSNELSWDLLDVFQTIPKMNYLNINKSKNEARNKDDIYDYTDFFPELDMASRTNYHFKRTGIEGRIFDYEEKVNLDDVKDANASNSLSLTRKIDNMQHTIQGGVSNLPFTPGGIILNTNSNIGTTVVDTNTFIATPTKTASSLLHKDDYGLFDIPPTLERGIVPQFIVNNELEDLDSIVEIKKADSMTDEQLGIAPSVQTTAKTNEKNWLEQSLVSTPKNDNSFDEEVDKLIPKGIDFGRTTIIKNFSEENREWAHVVDVTHKITNFDELVPNPARTWPFELDTFQKEAVYHLEQGDSVFVAAHTSAGKTVVAEYAIALSKRNMTKTIYTSPIKALSNQKYRDFKEEFDELDVGLITGDVQINPDGNCLIMTTEILRSMLYRGADVIRDVEFVIFDEVHYVNDQDRGVVWEEVIIMLPQHIKFILLSATVPNTYEFASWIGRTKQKNIYVISTPKRPVPLEINLWTKDELIPVITPDKNFLTDNFKKHKELLSGEKNDFRDKNGANHGTLKNNKSGRGGGRGGARGGARGGNNNTGNNKGGRLVVGHRGAGAIGSNKRQFYQNSGANSKTWPHLVNFLERKSLLPAVIFVFSKKRCEEYADSLSGVNFCGNKERSHIHMTMERAVVRLKKEDRELPQILKMRTLLERGIAVHHGGLLPIVKELVEILFAEGHVKVLFATETFAMGLNLPTRTVVFSEISKHDGTKVRPLNPGEFTQMAGRAGRRGLDTTGTVIIMTYKTPLEPVTFKEVTLGSPIRLQSQFRLTYNMILKLLKIEALRVEEMIKYSFSEDNNQALLPQQQKDIALLTERAESIEFYDNCEYCSHDIDKALSLFLDYKENWKEFVSKISAFAVFAAYFSTGRLVIYRLETPDEFVYKLGFIFRSFSKSGNCIVLCFTEENQLKFRGKVYIPYVINKKFIGNNFGTFVKLVNPILEEIPITNIELVSSYKSKTRLVSYLANEKEAIDLFEEEIGSIVKDLSYFSDFEPKKILPLEVGNLLKERKSLFKAIVSLQGPMTCPDFVQHLYPKYFKSTIEDQISALKHLSSDQNLKLLPDYEQRLKVLRDGEFIDKNANVLLKGRVACEIDIGYELVITELILDNFLGDFQPEEIVALLSVFVYDGTNKKNVEEPIPANERLTLGKDKIEGIYKKMLKLYEKHQVPITSEEEDFLERRRFMLLNVVYEWARGVAFKDIMEITDESEGTIVRIINRLDEICREVKTAAIIIGNSDLHSKMSTAQELIKRDIVFAASLYL
ncbi:related to Antiviral helicase SKI2 [Saccharomycodes ludwigii]|uniref:Related to Antiviral helicase SKI2 n=1 Tax=Saccharomycodes ludwigii TaxID=36035 RepID=A0A376B773_9ASCO|nr:related to Antiviral helicase SKI2 [Saccharomycodes ludwigii]